MSVTNDVRTFLLADSDITDLVGSGDSARAPLDFATQKLARPFLVIERVDTVHEATLSERSAGLAVTTVTVTSVADSRTAAAALAEKVRLRLQGFTGAMGSTTAQNVRLVRDSDSFQPDPNAWQTEMDFDIWHAETIPS